MTDAAPPIAALVERAWELSYLDPPHAAEIGRQIVEATQHRPDSVQAGQGWLQLALAESRLGEPARADEMARHARAIFERHDDVRGRCLADEVLAIVLRRTGDTAGALALQQAIDAEPRRAYGDHDQFLAYNSRALTCKRLDRAEDALRNFYRAHAAARRTGWRGPVIAAASNLGGLHQDLHNLDDARALCEQTLTAAREAQCRRAVESSASNLIVVHHALGQPVQARAMAQFLLTHADELLPGALDRLGLPLALAMLGSGELQAAQGWLDRGATSGPMDAGQRGFWAWLQARCRLAQGDTVEAARVAEAQLDAHDEGRDHAQRFDLLQLLRVAGDAREMLGEPTKALHHTRRAQSVYEDLIGRSARARYIALEVAHQVDSARRAAETAEASLRTAHDDRARLAELNRQLQAKIAETERLRERLEELALRDPLTGLHNRRYLFEVAPRMLDQAARQESSLCVVLLDLDHFKSLNDNWGHAAGDEVLKAFAALLSQSVRRSDVLCRHGGEEFVIVMPDMTMGDAQSMLNRLLEAYGELRVRTARQTLPRCSFSAGVAHFPTHGGTVDLLLSRADRALYSAKGHGRSRVELAQVSGFASL